MPSSPRESPRETRSCSPDMVPDNPMGREEMSVLKSRVCEQLLLSKESHPVLHIKAVWRRKKRGDFGKAHVSWESTAGRDGDVGCLG